MKHSKDAFEILFFALFSLSAIKLSYCLGNSTELCIEKEKQSLLRFKKSLTDPSNILSSWNAEHDCCKWDNVVCNTSMGHVLELKLQSPDRNSSLGGKIDPSLINLKFLRFLDLSQNDFDGTSIPAFLGSLASLEYLNLSSSGFQGTIPQLGNLSNLRSLGLRQTLDVDDLQWLSNLSHLEYLDLTYVNISKAHDWLDIVNMLPSLIELHLSGCSLDHFSHFDRVNFSSLKVLDLSSNSFKSSVPDWIFSFTSLESLQLRENMFEGPIPNATYGLANLRFLDLSRNKFNSPIPDWIFGCNNLESLSLNNNFLHETISSNIVNQRSLRALDLSVNMLTGKIPVEVGTLCNLQNLELSFNNFEGNISEVFGVDMLECFLASLKVLSVRANRLSGSFTERLGEFKNLQSLDLGNNSFTGSIPANLGNLSSLKILRFDNNKLTGNFPLSFGQLFSLQVLVMENNMLEGIVTENHFSNLTNLTIISASGNQLILRVNQDWTPPFQLSTIFLNSWNLGPHLPKWLQTQRNIDGLDLSSTGISGEIPTWFWNLSTIDSLNLSHNELRGQLPDVMYPRWIYFSSNKFSGPLPTISYAVKELDLSNNLFSGEISHLLCKTSTEDQYSLTILHLGGNQLSGKIPDCWKNWPSLQVINLGNNNISGTIPRSLGMLAELLSLNLFGNFLSGPIPRALKNCSMLIKMDLSRNDFVRNFPGWIGTSLTKLRILIVHSNSFDGEIPHEICQLNFLHILDLSSNNFTGPIPNCLNNLTALRSQTKLMNFSGDITYYSYFLGVFMESAIVTTKGTDLEYDTILSQFSSIDLSSNRLSGEIPREISNLAGLRSLNLSTNVLSGKIPESIGNMGVLESLDLSRNHISGEIPNSISSLTFLGYLNFSYNNLTGRIPISSQIQTFTESCFTGNDLCGPPLKNICALHGKNQSTETEEQHAEHEVDWFYVFMALGFVMGFGSFWVTLVSKKTWRIAYFRFLQEMFLNRFGLC